MGPGWASYGWVGGVICGGGGVGCMCTCGWGHMAGGA